MIVAFNKNELKDGTKRALSEYSNDLETRVKNEFDDLEHSSQVFNVAGSGRVILHRFGKMRNLDINVSGVVAGENLTTSNLQARDRPPHDIDTRGNSGSAVSSIKIAPTGRIIGYTNTSFQASIVWFVE